MTVIHHVDRTRVPRVAVLIRLLIVLVASAAGARAQEGASAARVEEDVDVARTALSKWVEVRAMTSKARTDWKSERVLLQERLDMLKRQLAELREDKASVEKNSVETQAKVDELQQRVVDLKQASSSLVAVIGGLEQRTRNVVSRLPVPLQEIVGRLAARIPESEETETKLTLFDRFQSVVAILNEANKFHKEIHAKTEVRKIAEDRTAEVPTLYLGLGRAFYATVDGTAGGYGVPGEKGWIWTAVSPKTAEKIALALAVFRNEEPAAFVGLPLRIVSEGK
ncbi:MAG: DUF3450 family protein [Planctomycetes bacterium]|nr:DUF3450 family protein [Planctomycetota bacterium]